VSENEDYEGHDPEALAAYLVDLRDFLGRSREALRQARREAPEAPPRLPLRQVLLDALDDLGYPVSSRTLGAYVQARTGRRVPANQFGRVAAQERMAFRRGGEGARPVWLSSGLAAEGFRPVKRIWGRSDWPEDVRVVAPTSARVQHLRATEALCRLAERAEEHAQDPGALRALALAHAADLPELGVGGDAPDFGRCAEAARALLDKYEAEDRRLRLEAAAHLATMPVEVRLFGVEPDGERGDVSV
jgi:hypothetical protein